MRISRSMFIKLMSRRNTQRPGSRDFSLGNWRARGCWRNWFVSTICHVKRMKRGVRTPKLRKNISNSMGSRQKNCQKRRISYLIRPNQLHPFQVETLKTPIISSKTTIFLKPSITTTKPTPSISKKQESTLTEIDLQLTTSSSHQKTNSALKPTHQEHKTWREQFHQTSSTTK